MTDISDVQQSKRLNFSQVPSLFFHPRRSFQHISTFTKAVWLTPLLILSCVALLNIIVAGRIKSQAALMGEITYPPDFQYYTPEQQAQYMQSIQSTQGPVFVYVLPGIGSLLGVWFGWLILGGLLHLVTTLFGGRGTTAISMNIVAWASLPLAVRGLVQIIYMIIAQKLITNQGLSGFSPSGETGFPLFFGQILRLIDIYLIWQILLVVLGVRLSTMLNPSKATFSVIITFLIILLLQTGLSYLSNILGNLTIARPFFF